MASTRWLRDYGLTGESSRLAIDGRLADASWYHPKVDPQRLQSLMARTNARAARDVVLWLALLVGAGVLAFRSFGHWWAIPLFALYGALYGGSADPRWHECGHGTAFKTPWPNDVVYTVASFMLLREPTLWRWSHFRHHSDTLIVGRDPEITFQRPFRLRSVVPNLLNLVNGPKMVWRMIRHALGSIDAEARDFVPAGDLRRVVREARAFVAVLTGVVVWSIAIGSIVPLLFVGLPSFYGVWLLWFFSTTQHAGLREDVLDHRLNTRTVYMNPVLRFLYLNMNYHLEHHLYPSVPYYALPALHAEVKDQLPEARPSMIAAYREVISALRHQRRDARWELPVPAELPAGSDLVVPAPGVKALGGTRVVDVGPADDVDRGGVVRVDVDGCTFALCRLHDGQYALVDGLCTHGQTHLAGGLIVDGAIECPKHNGRFDLRTGQAIRRPATIALRTYRIEENADRLYAHLGEAGVSDDLS